MGEVKLTKGEFVCRRCGSNKLQGTLPAWFYVNTFSPGIGELGPCYDGEAEWGYGWCESCDASGPFLAVAMRADTASRAALAQEQTHDPE